MNWWSGGLLKELLGGFLLVPDGALSKNLQASQTGLSTTRGLMGFHEVSRGLSRSLEGWSTFDPALNGLGECPVRPCRAGCTCTPQYTAVHRSTPTSGRLRTELGPQTKSKIVVTSDPPVRQKRMPSWHLAGKRSLR